VENIFGVMQENALTALVFHDRGCPIIRNSIPIQAFSNAVYRKVAERAFAFYDVHKKPPKDHIADELENELEGDNRELFSDVLRGMDRLKESLNLDYVLGKLDEFNRIYALRKNITESATALDAGDLEGAEQAISNYHSQRRYTEIEVYSIDKAADILLHHANRETTPLGVETYDSSGVGPARKELFLYGAPSKSGKSWFLSHVSRHALFYGWKVLFVTLEMSGPLVIVRMLQNLLSLPIRDDGKKDGTLVRYPELLQQKMANGKKHALFGSNRKEFWRKSLLRPDMVNEVVYKLGRMGKYVKNFKVVERPTGTLTLTGLESILDRLESTDGFIPDLLVIDYADLMHIDVKDYRLNLGNIYRGIRGIAGERNIAVATATQLTRQSLGKVTRHMTHVAEDFSKIFTCDQFLVYSQTDIEEELGLARLLLAGDRHGGYKREIVISQCYEVGQFLIQALPIHRTYMPSYYGAVNRRMEERRRMGEDAEGEEDMT
jgi:DnaB-like helicase C terminal domain